MAVKAMLAALLGAPLALAFISPPAAAHADVSSYLAYLADHHVNTAFNRPATNIYIGLRVCEMLDAGMTAEQVAQGATSMADMPGMIAAAQHEICPHTKR